MGQTREELEVRKAGNQLLSHLFCVGGARQKRDLGSGAGEGSPTDSPGSGPIFAAHQSVVKAGPQLS